MKRPTTLLYRVLLNEALQVSVAVEHDVREIGRRFEHEGMSFLTIALPSLCDSLDQGLAQGRLTPHMFHGFKPCKRGGRLPALLQGFFRRVFNDDGSLLDCPCIASIRAIRQVTRLFKKVELPCSAARVKQAFERYKSNDENISDTPSYPALLRRVAGYLWSDLEEFSRALYCSPGVFGGGATGERYSFNERHSLSQWPQRGEDLYPLSFHGSFREDDVDSFAGVELIPPSEELPVRVVQVPKTLKTPRIISVEPSYMMLRQQSVAKVLMDYLEFGQFKHRSIRFTDQSVNNSMAQAGSIDGSLATIDLKDASDLVSLRLVEHIFGVAPQFREFILAARSSRAQLPDGSVITLRKYASQGSALCFPIEAMTFFTIVMMSLVRQSGRCLSQKLLTELSARVSVYGDDIVVPAETAPGVMEDLELCGLRVNQSKSFWQGFFRESCGGDYYKGHDVTPSYCRVWDFTGNIRDTRTISGYVSLSNQFYLKGLWDASQFIRDFVEARRGVLARTDRPVGGLTWASVSFNTKLRWDPDRQAFRIKTPHIVPGRVEDPARDIRAVMLLRFGPGGLRKHRSSLISQGWDLRRVSARPHKSYQFTETPERSEGEHSCSPGLRSSDHQKLEDLGIGSVLKKAFPLPLDLDTSVDSYSSNVKSRWTDVTVGLPGWIK